MKGLGLAMMAAMGVGTINAFDDRSQDILKDCFEFSPRVIRAVPRTRASTQGVEEQTSEPTRYVPPPVDHALHIANAEAKRARKAAKLRKLADG